MNSVGMSLNNFTRWVGQKVVGRDDFSTSADTRQRDFAVLGAATGAVAGATIGTITGFNSQKANSIEEVWVDRKVVHPQMNGYSHHTSADYSTECVERNDENACVRSETNLDGWWHSYSPNITDRVVGNYNEPTFQNTNKWEPLTGGVVGAIGGGLVGLGVGLGLAALTRSLQDERLPSTPPKLSPEAEKALTTRAGAAAVGGAVLGTVVGAVVGSHAGQIELASRESHTRYWSVPVTQTETIGHVPSGHYERNWFGSTWASPDDVNRNANQPVNRTVPVYQRDGDVRFAPTEKEFQTNRYGPIFGGIVGGAVGAGVGLATGLLIGVTDKLLSERALLKAENSPAA